MLITQGDGTQLRAEQTKPDVEGLEAQLELVICYGGAGKPLQPQDSEYSSAHRPGTHTVPDWYK